MADRDKPHPGGWNRVHLIVDDLYVETSPLQTVGVRFRSDIVTDLGSAQILLAGSF